MTFCRHCCSVAKSCATLCDPINYRIPGFSVLHYLPKFAQVYISWVSDAFQPSHPLPAPSSFAFSLCQHQVFIQWVGSSYWVAKVLELQLQHLSFNEYSGLISFKIDWFDLLAVQGTLKSIFQHHNSKASILQCSAFFMVQLSHPYMTTGTTIALTRRTFVDKVMSLLFNTLSRFVTAFLPRSKYLLFSWLKSLYAVILEHKKIKSDTASTFSSSICHIRLGQMPWSLLFEWYKF